MTLGPTEASFSGEKRELRKGKSVEPEIQQRLVVHIQRVPSLSPWPRNVRQHLLSLMGSRGAVLQLPLFGHIPKLQEAGGLAFLQALGSWREKDALWIPGSFSHF